MKASIAASILFLCLSACGKLNFDPRPVAGDEFSPKSISGLSFWLRADQGVSTDPSSGNVTSWVESISGTMSFGTPAGSGVWVPPVFSPSNSNFNGRATVSFGTSTLVETKHLAVSSANVPVLCDGSYTFFAVLRPNLSVDGTNTTSYLSFMGGSNTLANAFLSYSAGPSSGHNIAYDLIDYLSLQKKVYSFTGSLPQFQTGVAAVGAVFSVADGATALVRDGSSVVLQNSASVAYNGLCSGITVKVGLNSNSSTALLGTLDIAELMIYDWPLGATELNALGCYAKNRYGIPGYSGTCN